MEADSTNKVSIDQRIVDDDTTDQENEKDCDEAGQEASLSYIRQEIARVELSLFRTIHKEHKIKQQLHFPKAKGFSSDRGSVSIAAQV